MYTIQIYKGKGLIQRWRFRIVSSNGQTVAQSEGYFSRWNAKRAATKQYPNAPVKYL